MPDSVNLDRSVEVWRATTGYVSRNPALALPKIETPASQNLCGPTAFLAPKNYGLRTDSRKPAKCKLLVPACSVGKEYTPDTANCPSDLLTFVIVYRPIL